MKIVLVTGGFDPLHSGHIAYFKAARTLGDMLIVGLNNDEWLARKKGRAFMPWNERLCVINNLAMVDEVYTFDDEDDSACAFIHQVRAHYPDADLVFANGGDRTADNIPEMKIQGVEFVFGVGGENKANSSSAILASWPGEQVGRDWGNWRVLSQINNTVKVKELVVDVGHKLSMQRHQHRSELWVVVQGHGQVNWEFGSSKLSQFKSFVIQPQEWHQLVNTGNEPLIIVEIQHGIDCIESDIERR